MLRAVELHAGLDIPFERVQIQLRAGIALAAAGERDAALEQLGNAYRGATRLGAVPLAGAATAEVARLGESVRERLGQRAAAEHLNGGLSARELEVMRLVAAGATNREIAAELVLSTRTVDMHVRNILTKLRCRTRTEAASKAGSLGLLA
jgi:DNA-binding NarL/FixJ family response regulator